jgi:Beta-lactamase class C and other penicillin binding proteins
MNYILHKGLMVCLILLLNAACAFSQRPIKQAKLDTISSFIERTCLHHHVPGLTFVMVYNDSIVACKTVGVLEVGKNERVSCQSSFRLASISKSFTAIAVLQLAQKGAVNLNDPVVKYLPFFASRDIERSNRITISQLLSHTSGIPRNAFGLQLPNGTEKDEELQVRQLKKIRLSADPGERFQYCDFNYYVLQALVSHCAKEPFPLYMQKNVFRKMGMLRTGYYSFVSANGNLAIGHNPRKGIPKPLYYTNPYTINGGDGVYSNGADMAQYIRFLTNSGHFKNDTILSDSSFKKLFQPHAEGKYGYGWFIKSAHQTLQIHHDGEAPNYSADLYIYPKEKLGFAILCNDYNDATYKMGESIDQYLFEGVLDEVTSTKTQENVKGAMVLMVIDYILSFLVALFMIIYATLLLKGRIKLRRIYPISIASLLKICIPISIGLFTTNLVVKRITVTSGAIYISRIYEPDLVNSALILLTLINIILLLVVVALFTQRKKLK